MIYGIAEPAEVKFLAKVVTDYCANTTSEALMHAKGRR